MSLYTSMSIRKQSNSNRHILLRPFVDPLLEEHKQTILYKLNCATCYLQDNRHWKKSEFEITQSIEYWCMNPNIPFFKNIHIYLFFLLNKTIKKRYLYLWHRPWTWIGVLGNCVPCRIYLSCHVTAVVGSNVSLWPSTQHSSGQKCAHLYW